MAVSSQEILIEERKELMVSPCGGKPFWKVAHFLKPSFPNPQKTQLSQTIFKPSKPTNPNSKTLSSEVYFNGWKPPLKNWSTWVKKFQLSFGPTWKKTSIFDPIMASTLEIPRYHDTSFALAQRWSPKTNTFVFPWGEATITLEDIMVFGGFSVTGDSVLSELCSTEQCRIEDSLCRERSKLFKSKSRNALQQKWMDVWMKNESEFEHEAFLSCWLSRCVLPVGSVNTIINKDVFPIAILLAQGIKIALAPAVLAGIYRDLRLLKQMIDTLESDQDVTKLVLRAPLQLLQVWFWERFPLLSPKPNPIINELPRLAMWHKVKILKISKLGSAIDSSKEEFRWRPYCTALNNWSVGVNLYPEEDGWLSVDTGPHLDLVSYVRCIRVSELVGLDCVEQYQPHRVSMQFGLDQDIPVDIPELNSSHEIAWENYGRPTFNNTVKLYMPSRLTESDVTTRYLEWWQKPSFVVAERERIKTENNEADVPPGYAPKRIAVVDISSDQSSSKRSKTSSGSPSFSTSSTEVDATPSSPHISRMESGGYSDDCDHLTLKDLFRLGSTSKDDKNGTFSSINSESPCDGIRRVSNLNDEIEKEVSSPITSTHEKQAGTSCSVTPEFAGKIDLADRIGRLRIIVDFIKATTSANSGD